MINILTKPYSEISGPNKVVENLIKGLDIIKYPYVINKKADYCENIFIPNGRKNLLKASINIRSKNKIIAGPNFFVLPCDVPFYLKPIIKRLNSYIHPAEWVKTLWEKLNFNLTKIKVWPTGIDTYQFRERQIPSKMHILVYFKQREIKFLKNILHILNKKKLEYTLIEYGKYREDNFISEMKKTSFIIWYGRHESQGIALEECLSSDIPILVLESKSLWNQRPDFGYETYKSELKDFEVTTVPYFDKNCGIILENYDLIEQSIDYMSDNYRIFSPREYILKNLSLEKQAWDLINLFDDE